MDLGRAHKIVSAISCGAFIPMGIGESQIPFWLENVSLSEMLDAKRLVEEDNEAQKRNAQGGKYTFSIVPDDRLIAAVYALIHYDPENRAIVADGQGRMLAVLAPGASADEDEIEEQAA